MESWKRRAEEVRADERAFVYESIALDCIKLGKISFENIAKVCHLTLEQVQILADSLKS